MSRFNFCLLYYNLSYTSKERFPSEDLKVRLCRADINGLNYLGGHSVLGSVLIEMKCTQAKSLRQAWIDNSLKNFLHGIGSSIFIMD